LALLAVNRFKVLSYRKVREESQSCAKVRKEILKDTTPNEDH
jgi:hypothetical protein